MRAPHPQSQRAQVRLRRHEQVGHRRGCVPSQRDLPARHKNIRRGKLLPCFHVVIERKATEKMRSAKGCSDVAHGNGVLQRIINPALHVGKPLRAARLVCDRDLGSRDRCFHGRSLRIEMRLVRLENRFEHGERIQRIHGERDAHELLPAIAPRRRLTFAQEGPERLR